jgi:HIV Tat-specific factor 1
LPKRHKSKDHPRPDRKNSAVYVTSLPVDATVDEISSVFSKCGVIAEELESGLPRIKLYHDEAGKPKGDALVVYFRPESVQLAIQMLDDSDFRFGVRGPAGNMRVKEADFSYKKQKEAPTVQNAKDKQKIMRKAQKMTR